METMTNKEFLELCAMTTEQLNESELGREIASLSEELGIPHSELLALVAQAKLLDGFDDSLTQSQKPSPETEPGSQPKTKASRSRGKGPTTSKTTSGRATRPVVKS